MFAITLAHYQMMLWLIRGSWIMDAHRITHAPSLGVAGAAGNTAGLIAPLTFMLTFLPIRGVRKGCSD
jgi:hypothetical protein